MWRESCYDAEDDGERHVETKDGIVSCAQERETLVGEGGEGGQAAAESRGEQQRGLWSEVPGFGFGVEKSDEEATKDIDDKGRPWKEHAGKGWQQSEMLPQARDREAQARPDATPEENVEQILHF